MEGVGLEALAREVSESIREYKNRLGAKRLGQSEPGGEDEGVEPLNATDEADSLLKEANLEPVSLLWPTGEPGQGPGKAANWLDSNSARDLELEDLVREIASATQSGRAEQIKRILLHLSTDAEVLRYRQEILADLVEEPALIVGFEALLPKLRDLGLYGNVSRDLADIYQVTWWLGKLELYTECVLALGALFDEVEVHSAGLRRLRELITAIHADPAFQNLKQELPGLLERIRGVSSVTIGVNLDPQLKPQAATLLSVNTEPFVEAPLLKLLLGKTGEQEGMMQIHTRPSKVPKGVNPMLAPLFRDLSEVMAEISGSIAGTLKRYIGASGQFLVDLESELAFYVGAAHMVQRIREAGLPLCRPEIAPPEARVYEVAENYNVNLALHHLNRREAQELSEVVVTNDVHMGAEGRVYILTGPNQGGKTTYTQAVGLTQIMAQTGLYVPGERARISPVDGIYTHYPLEEELEKGTGRLGDETQRLNVLFSQVTRHSLMLLNESLSSTAPGESLYLARDVVRILRLLGARAIFVTHLHQLAADAESLNAETPGDSRIVSIVASLTEEDEGSNRGDSADIRRTYKVVPNPPMGRSYAMEIAKRYGISYEQLKETLAERGVLKTSS